MPERFIYNESAAQAEARGSLLLRLAWFCKEQTLTLEEMREIVGPVWLERSCFEIMGSAAARLRKALDISELEWRIVQARTLVPSSRSAELIVSQVRYCPRCLAMGWHSAIFQHLAVRFCPQHQIPLITGCRNCGVVLDATPRTLAEHHLYCPDCDEPLAGQCISRTQTDLSKFEAVRSALTRPIHGRAEWPPASKADRSLRSTADCNAAAAHWSWSRRPVPGLRGFKQTSAGISVEEDDLSGPTTRRQMFDSALMSIQWIKDCVVAQCGSDSVRSCVRLMSGMGDDAEMSIAAVALGQLALAMNMRKVLNGGPPEFHRTWEYSAQRWLPNRINLIRQMIEAHVFLLFTINLLKARRYRTVRDVEWCTPLMLDDIHVIPAWWIDYQENSAILTLRSRVGQAGVERLVRRYRTRMLSPINQR